MLGVDGFTEVVEVRRMNNNMMTVFPSEAKKLRKRGPGCLLASVERLESDHRVRVKEEPQSWRNHAVPSVWT
ncbi:hypothetical protein DEJ23_10760 [Curtobacterium sp. MCSS17_008]|nr:hypothetical protein DEJ23_10760 [Curtobacterium sp. MCSS17_008]